VRRLISLSVFVAAFLLIKAADAATLSNCTTVATGISCTGSLDTPEDVFLETFTLSGSSSIVVQTYGFGGGTNAAGTPVPFGGFDSLVALFSGPVATATILTDGGGNPIGSDPATTQFSSGCGPAGQVSIAGDPPVCGDNTLSVSLLAGSYTLLLSDALYEPFAFNPGPPTSSLLSDGFSDLSPGIFQTCDLFNCQSDNGTFAVDILASPNGGPPPVPTPEPAGVALSLPLWLGLAVGWGRLKHFRHSR